MAGERIKPTKKEGDFAKEYAKTGNGTQAILKTYNTKDPKTASVMAVENLAKPRIQKLILSIADKIPDELLVKKHLELLNVPKVKRVYIKGEMMSEVEETDSQAIGKGLDMAYKIKGYYAPDKVIIPIVIIPEERKKELNDILFNE